MSYRTTPSFHTLNPKLKNKPKLYEITYETTKADCRVKFKTEMVLSNSAKQAKKIIANKHDLHSNQIGLSVPIKFLMEDTAL